MADLEPRYFLSNGGNLAVITREFSDDLSDYRNFLTVYVRKSRKSGYWSQLKAIAQIPIKSYKKAIKCLSYFDDDWYEYECFDDAIESFDDPCAIFGVNAIDSLHFGD